MIDIEMVVSYFKDIFFDYLFVWINGFCFFYFELCGLVGNLVD